MVAQFDVARGMPGSIIVNQDARRFVNEAVPYNEFPRPFGAFDPATLDFANRDPAWQIFDHGLKEELPILSLEPGKPAPGWVAQAGTIRELAPPFYAIAIHPGALGTNGGPRIDADARVQRAGGGCIPGLYAAGNTAANAFGWAYPSGGGTLGNAMTFGFRAGRHVATRARREL